MTNMYLNLYALTEHSVNCMNRDELGEPKSVVYGGTLRARVSSQCLKRAIRQEYADRADRSTEMVEHLAQQLEAAQQGANSQKDLTKVVQGILTKKEKESEKKKKKPIIVLSKAEQRQMIEEIQKELDGQSLTKERITEIIDKVSQRLTPIPSLDIALFGRMCTGNDTYCTDAAVSFGHMITTHPIVIEYDFFAAEESLAEHGGAGHINDQGFGAGTYYRYCSINLRQLSENLEQLNTGGNSATYETVQGKMDKMVVDEIVRFAGVFYLAIPSGKKNGMASGSGVYRAASLSPRPLTLEVAFSDQTKASMQESVDRLERHLVIMPRFDGYEPKFKSAFKDTGSITDVLDWIREQL